MSIDTKENGMVRHMPAKADKFEFDREVSEIFPDMARRSIPNYNEFHALHARIVLKNFLPEGAAVLDVGASRAAFFVALSLAAIHYNLPLPKFTYTALDNSAGMCELTRQEMLPYENVEVQFADVEDDAFMQRIEQYDVINCTYVIQFLSPRNQERVIRKMISMLKPGGVLILGQKDFTHTGDLLGNAAHESYLEWRVKNGYSREEIAAKTEALKNSMWAMEHDDLLAILRDCRVSEIVPTTRTLMFNTLMCRK